MDKTYDEMTKEELVKLLDEQTNKKLKEKATLKEFTTTYILKSEDTLFMVPNGFLIGKPYFGEGHILNGYIMLTDVVMLDSLSSVIKKVDFTNMIFQLAIDQIIAYSPVDRTSFLSQLQSQ